MRYESDIKPPYTKRKKNLNFCIFRYHINGMVILMPEVKCNFFPGFAVSLDNYAYRTKDLPLKCICGPYNYGKTVWSRENLMTPSCFVDHCSPGYNKSFKLNWKKFFFVGQSNLRNIRKKYLSQFSKKKCICIEIFFAMTYFSFKYPVPWVGDLSYLSIGT